MRRDEGNGFSLVRRLWFMGRPLPVRQTLTRLWRSGRCRFTDIAVNEHPIVQGTLRPVAGEMAHHDSPDLDHWLEKQNRYTTTEAIIAYQKLPLADIPRRIWQPWAGADETGWHVSIRGRASAGKWRRRIGGSCRGESAPHG